MTPGWRVPACARTPARNYRRLRSGNRQPQFGQAAPARRPCSPADRGDKAIEDNTEAIRLDPNYARAYHFRGAAYLVKGEHGKAIADITEAIRLDPNYAKAYNNRGIAYEEIGEKAKAAADYAKAKQIGFEP